METQAHGGHGFAVRLPLTVSADNHEADRPRDALAAAQFQASIQTSSFPGNRRDGDHANLPQRDFLGPKPTTVRILCNKKLSTALKLAGT
jgi:hypothetical protein